MSEVLIDDSSLNKIANSIRGKNGLRRTYKPREMAPAIRAFRNYIPHAHEYNVQINQTPNQTITVKKYLEINRRNHTGTFTVTEPFYILEVSIEADIGYEAGQLNVQSPIVLDRDLIIEATPATPVDSSLEWTTVYLNGSRGSLWGNGSQQDTWFWIHYHDEDCTESYGNGTAEGKVIFQDVTSGKTDGRHIFGNTQWGSCDGNWRGSQILEAICRVHTQNFSNMQYCFRRLSNMIKVDIRSFDTANVGSFNYMFLECSCLRYIYGIQDLNTSELLSAQGMFSGCSQLFSLDLSQWNTPKLINCNEMFSGCGVLFNLDISNWDTRYITSFTPPPNVKYIIMDEEEVKFNGDFIFNNPNNKVKYLVPTSVLNEYKAHPNWSSRASQIYDVTDFNIVRYNGQVEVNPNI